MLPDVLMVGEMSSFSFFNLFLSSSLLPQFFFFFFFFSLSLSLFPLF